MRQTIIGAKGNKGGATFVTRPDTLRSNDSFEILLGLGSGRWKGLTNGLPSLKINGVPMENADGTSNFEDISALFADGNPLAPQLVTFNLGGGGQTQSVNTALSNITGAGPGPWVVGAVSTLGANFIDLRFVVQQLFYQDEKSIRENTATVEVQMRPSGTSTWINPFVGTASSTVTYDPEGYVYDDSGDGIGRTVYLSRSMFNSNGVGFAASGNPNLVITGKTNSAFVKEVRIAVPNEGSYVNKSWEVRARLVEKDTNDADKIQERRSIVFESITAVINQPLGDHPDWEGQVWLQIHGKASNQFSGFPEIEGIFDTKICKVPPLAVFNPDTRAYTNATWDGSYVESFTTDPAWQIKEFVEDPIHGLAGLQPGSTLDKWDALEASKYYSELVPDGKGGTHPRFSMNLTINEAREVEEMMGYLAGAVNSYTEDVGGGVWRLKVDKPETPLMLFTEDNVFGEFNYSHTDVDTRFNDWRGTFLNEDLDYQPDTVRVFDQDDIDNNGLRFTEVALVGCTNRQEALRRLMFRLRVSLNEYKIVTFTTNRIGRYISPLSTILVADAALNSDELVKSTSRLDSTVGTTVTLKRPVRLEVGVNYTVTFSTTAKQIVTRTITNTAAQRGDVTTLYIDSALPSTVMAESAVALQATGLGANPISYRVIGVERSEQDEDQYTIIASIIDSGKWNAMDNVSQDDLNAQVSDISIDAPTIPADGMFELVTYNTDYQTKRVLQVNWNRPGGSYLDGYYVDYRINDGPWMILNENLKDSYAELENPEDSTYDFRIVALDRRGVRSSPLIGRYVVLGSRETIAPTHLRGPLSFRPATAPYNGFRYTVTDGPAELTYVWENGAWVLESTEGAPPGTLVGDWYAEDVSNKLDEIDVDIAGALSDAAAAEAAAAAAMDIIDDIISDSILHRSEKSAIIKEYNSIIGEQATLVAQAQALFVDPANLQAKENALTTYLGSLGPPAWNALDGDTPINGTTFRAKFSDYYIARAALMTAMINVASTTAEWDGVTGTGKDELIDSVERISSDGWLSAAEKPQVMREYDRMINYLNSLVVRHDALGQPPEAMDERNAAGAAVYNGQTNSIGTYLYGSMPTWRTAGVDTQIPNVTTYNTRWTTAIEAVNAFAAALIGLVDVDIQAAINDIVDMSDDGLWTPNEKITVLIPRDAELEAIWATMDDYATPIVDTTVDAAHAAALAARLAWQTLRNNADQSGAYPEWNDTSGPTPINRVNARTVLTDYAKKLEALSQAIRAYTDIKATTALDRVNALISDNVLARPEKYQMVLLWQELNSRYNAMNLRKQALGQPASLTTVATAAANAIDTGTGSLGYYLGTLNPAWNDSNYDTNVDGATMTAKWTAAYSAMANYEAAFYGHPDADKTSTAIDAGVADTRINTQATSAANTAIAPVSARVTTTENKTSQLNTSGRIVDSRALNVSNIQGMPALQQQAVIFPNDYDAFSPGHPSGPVAISVQPFYSYNDWDPYTGVQYPEAFIPNCAYNTTYFIWRNVTTPGSAGTSWQASTNLQDALGVNKVYVGYLRTPTAAGQSNTVETGGSGDKNPPSAGGNGMNYNIP